MTNPRLHRGAVLVLAAFLLAGCGAKGDLYLPKQESAPPAAGAKPTPEDRN